jgi:hypothetical protein
VRHLLGTQALDDVHERAGIARFDVPVAQRQNF